MRRSLLLAILLNLIALGCQPSPTAEPTPLPTATPTPTPLPTETPVPTPDERLLRFAEALKLALETQDRVSLASLIAQEEFLLGGYRSEYVPLTGREALAQLEDLLGPREVVVRLDVDALALAGEFIAPPPGTERALFSTGWGPGKSDDAFLMIGAERGVLRWTAMIYVAAVLRDYPLPNP